MPASSQFSVPIRRPVYLQVAEQIREAIYDGRFAPGQALPAERELAELIGTSRPSVREALRALEAEGLIITGGTPARATVATELDRPAREAMVNLLRLRHVTLDELVELRILLERAAVQRAAARAQAGGPGPHLAEAHAAVQDMATVTDDLDAFDDADVRFHVALARASGNEAMHLIMLALRDPVSAQIRAAFGRQTDLGAALGRSLGEHTAILQAVEAGDGARAADLMDQHIRVLYQDAFPTPSPETKGANNVV